MYVAKHSLFLFVFATVFQLISCKCRQSFTTICDSFEDIEENEKAETWTELIVGSENSKPTETVNLMEALNLRKYHKLINLFVINKIKNLEKEEGFRCDYDSKHLNSVNFYGNEFKDIEDYHFPTVKVKKLSLINNKIENIRKGAFRSHPVEIFDVSLNSLEVIESDALPQTPYTKVIIAKNNKLTTIKPGSFPPSLRSLHLDGNSLRILPLEAIASLTNLEELTLSDNDFRTVPSIGHMTKLVVLDLSSNSIASINSAVFKDLNSLQLVDFSYNNMVDVNVLNTLFTPAKPAEFKISLSFNRLRDLNLTNLSFRKETLVLYGNPWDCQTWDQIQRKLFKHESECDKTFFANGRTPYCVGYKSGNTFSDSEWEEYIEQFHATIEKNEEFIDCDLVLERDTLLDPVMFNCVNQ